MNLKKFLRNFLRSQKKPKVTITRVWRLSDYEYDGWKFTGQTRTSSRSDETLYLMEKRSD